MNHKARLNRLDAELQGLWHWGAWRNSKVRQELLDRERRAAELEAGRDAAAAPPPHDRPPS